MMNMIVLGVGTVLTAAYLFFLFRGAEYDGMIEPLDTDEFPFKTLYSAGFALGQTKLFRLRGKLGVRLRDTAALYYGKKYSEYYARAIWAQVLSLSWFSLAVFLLAASCFTNDMGTFLALMGIVVAALAVYYFITYAQEKLNKRRDACESELPSAISKLALLVNSGTTLHEAWRMTAEGKDGVFYDLMRKSCVSMDNGLPEIDAVYEFGASTGSSDVKKFTSALIQSIERGGGELPMFLANQSAELWAQYRQRLLQKGEQAASGLLMPVALMFGGVIIIVLASAMQSFSL